MSATELTLADLEDEEFQRKLQQEFDDLSPEEQAEFEALVEQANEALPGMHASLDRMQGRMKEMTASISEIRASVSRLNSRLDKVETRLGGDFDGWKPNE